MGLIDVHVYLDFDNDLDFSDADEDISEYAVSVVIQRGTDKTLQAGSLELTVKDTDGRFQPQRSSETGLDVGRRVKVTMSLGGGTEVDQFYGFITEVSHEYIAAEEQVPMRSILAADLLRLLEIRRITTGTLLNKKTGEIVDLLLDNLGWEPGICTLDRSYLDTPDALLGGSDVSRRYIDDGQTTIPFCQWQDTPIAEALRQVTEAEHGAFWIGKDGWVHYEDRHHRNGIRDPNAELTDEHISELVVNYNDDELFNHVEVVAHPRSVGTAESVVFEAVGTGQGHKLEAGDTREYAVSYTDPETGRMCEVTDIVTPVAGVDYVANDAADGSGNTRTSDLSVTFEADDNGRYTYTVTNSGSTTLYLTKLQVRATPLVSYDAVAMTASNDLSIVQYLQRDLVLDSWLLSNPLEAQDYADWLLYLHKGPAVRVGRLTLFDSTWATALQIVNREISDLVSIDSERYNLSGDYFVDTIKIESDAASGQTRCDWGLSRPSEILFFTLDADTLDSDAVLGY